MNKHDQTFETVIGLEVHVELSTRSKIFCGCQVSFGEPPNTRTCPICLGHPGVLPVLNKQAVQAAMKASFALNCTISDECKFDRKNYFYPDLPKAYQIPQLDHPIGKNGWLEINVNNEKKRIGITRLHLEEDAGKLNHMDNEDFSLVDFNRAGVPLIEIVSEPDLRSPAEAKAYLEKMKTIILYTGISDVKMEEGSLRCDANISLRPIGEMRLGVKTEMKNLNSFRNVEKALLYEEKRQSQLLREGKSITQQSLRWLEAENKTKVMRNKEEANDYRYFPEPDLICISIQPSWKDEIQRTIPVLPDERMKRYTSEYKLSSGIASILTTSHLLADFFEETLEQKVNPQLVANWMTSDLLGYINAEGCNISDLRITPETLAQLMGLIENGTISTNIAKKVFKEMLQTGEEPLKIVEENGLAQIIDEDVIKQEIEKVCTNYPQSIVDLKNGKTRALSFLTGQVLKATKGKANPSMVNQFIRQHLRI